VAAVLIGLSWAFSAAADDGAPGRADARKPVDFAARIRPILARACWKCHGPEKPKGGLRLDSRAAAMAGGDSGEPAIRPGDPRAGELMKRVTSDDPGARMPLRGDRLPPDEIALLERWIVAGAPWADRGASASAPAVAVEKVVTDADREHWAFRPLRDVMPPIPASKVATPHPIDRFLLAAMDPKGLAMAPEAGRQTLIRRLNFDLVGLPPSPEQVEAFVRDRGADAYERLVDRLLASPHHGERWGRHWLDVARYADSDGYEGDLDRRTAFRYRDFVIRALNADMPFDRFVRWQVAGDEEAPDDPEALAATGFCTAAPSQETTPADTEENKARIRYDELDNMLSTVGSGLLGLTIGCARCHDHKFDPIPTRDYYRMLAAFTGSSRREAPLSKPHRDLERWLEEQRRLYREDAMRRLGLSEEEKFWLRQPEHFFVPVQIALYKKYGKALESTPESLRAWMTESRRATWRTFERAAAEAQHRGADPLARVLMLLDRGAVPEASYLLGRGSVTARKEVVTPGFLQVLTEGTAPEEYLAGARSARKGVHPEGITSGDGLAVLGTTYRRAAMAEWLTDLDRGAGALLARVIVNRLWQHHFGEGLVRTPDDFGRTGDRPIHPELLDWLARELIRNGWRLKPIHRMIVTSAAYRQRPSGETHTDRPRGTIIDPDNRLLWHRRPIRLEAEAVRDAMLAASGRLRGSMYGAAFRPPIPPEAISTRSKDAYPANIKDGPESWRRSVYAFVKRSVVNPFGETFDAPDTTATCGRRNTTTVPTQSLALLNDPIVRSCAGDLARRVVAEVGPDTGARVRRAYELALGRPPRGDELAAGLDFLGANRGPDSLADFCHVLFTLNEFLYID
jgi:hypothetical protein